MNTTGSVLEPGRSPAQQGAPRVLAVLPRGETFRNFAYSGVLQRLELVNDLAVAAVDPDGRSAELLGLAGLEPSRIDKVAERFPVRLARTLLDQAHGRHLWSEAAQERWRRRDMEAVTLGQRARRLFWRSGGRLLASQSGLAAISRAERAASRRFPPASGASDLISGFGPDLVFNGSHIHSAPAVPVVQAARWAGVPTSTFLFSWDNLTSQGRLLDIYDHFLAWNEAIADDLVRMYPRIGREQVTVTGTPQFDCHLDPVNRWGRDRWAREVGVDPDRPVVLYTTGMPNHMPGEPEIVELLADQLSAMGSLGSPQLLVRVYAKDRSGRFDGVRQRRPDIAFSPVPWLEEWLTPLPEDTPLWTSTLAHVACGVNVASTVSLELCMFDKPVINVAFNPPSVPRSLIDYSRYYRFDHYAPVVESGSVAIADTPDALRLAVLEAFTQPDRARDSRARILESMFAGTLDGQSSRRVAEALTSLAADSRNGASR